MHVIRSVTLAASLSLAAIGTAGAADLGGDKFHGTKDYGGYPALWQGRYFGAVIGANAIGTDVNGVGVSNKYDVDGASLSGGMLVGYNFRSGPWVAGFEADITAMGVDEKKNVPGLGTLSMSGHGAASLRLRAGYAWDALFLYATGGLAASHLELKSSLGGSQSGVWVTPVIGLGAEYAFDDKWTMRAEALATSGSSDIALAGQKRDIDFAESSVRLGVTRRF